MFFQIKKVHKLIIGSFIGPFILTFFIALFILLMQFLFKYIDDLVGKGLEWYVVLQLLMYASSTLVPMALPLAILLSSIMTFGNLGEHYELVALKSSGISLRRIMMPLITIVFIISIGAFFFSNIVMPYANLKMGALMWDVRNQKPSLAIKPGEFYNGIDGYSIRVAEKGEDGSTLKNIVIYNHTANNGNMNVLLADSGKMLKSENDRYLVIMLYNGISYEETGSPGALNNRKQLTRAKFHEHEVKFDLSTFQLNRTDENLFKDHYTMLNLKQLKFYEDSLSERLVRDKEFFHQNYALYTNMNKSFRLDSSVTSVKRTLDTNIIRNFKQSDRTMIISRAFSTIRNVASYTETAKKDQDAMSEKIRRHLIETHRKFTLPFACMILFFIGAPLGAIIRKGGLGMPIVISIFFFIFFHILSITGEKMARQDVVPVWQGMWMASFILTPIGIFITRKASLDSTLLDLDVYSNFFRKLFKKKSK
jgi:lipopolysaccharide export system permease protein